MTVQRGAVRSTVVASMLFLMACSFRTSENEAVSMSTDWVDQYSACHELAADLVQAVPVGEMSDLSVSALWSQLSRTNSILKSVILETARQRRMRELTSPRDVFEVFDQVALQVEGYPGDECDLLFHELLAEKLYLRLADGGGSRTRDEFTLIPAGDSMREKRRLLQSLIEEADRAGGSDR